MSWATVTIAGIAVFTVVLVATEAVEQRNARRHRRELAAAQARKRATAEAAAAAEAAKVERAFAEAVAYDLDAAERVLQRAFGPAPEESS